MKKKLYLTFAAIALTGILSAQTGNVGINTTTPRTRLEVNGALAVGAGPAPSSVNLTYIAFNSLRPGVGETEFVNYRGTGAGGFRFYSIANSGAPAYPAHWSAYIGINGDYQQVSDARVKSNIAPLSHALQAVLALNPVSYDLHTGTSLKNGVVSRMDKDDHPVKANGFIAQELYKVVPEAVNKPRDEANEFYSVSYSALVPLLTKAIQEQQAQIEAQNKRIAELEKQLQLLYKTIAPK